MRKRRVDPRADGPSVHRFIGGVGEGGEEVVRFGRTVDTASRSPPYALLPPVPCPLSLLPAVNSAPKTGRIPAALHALVKRTAP